MSKIIYDRESFYLMNLLGKIGKVRVKDCFKEEETYYFIVEKGEAGKAIGKGAANVKKLREILKKNIRIVEFAGSASDFVKNFIFPIKVDQIFEEDGIVKIQSDDKKIKGQLVGRDAKNLKLINKVVQRFFDVEVKVI